MASLEVFEGILDATDRYDLVVGLPVRALDRALGWHHLLASVINLWWHLVAVRGHWRWCERPAWLESTSLLLTPGLQLPWACSLELGNIEALWIGDYVADWCGWYFVLLLEFDRVWLLCLGGWQSTCEVSQTACVLLRLRPLSNCLESAGGKLLKQLLIWLALHLLLVVVVFLAVLESLGINKVLLDVDIIESQSGIIRLRFSHRHTGILRSHHITSSFRLADGTLWKYWVFYICFRFLYRKLSRGLCPIRCKWRIVKQVIVIGYRPTSLALSWLQLSVGVVVQVLPQRVTRTYLFWFLNVGLHSFPFRKSNPAEHFTLITWDGFVSARRFPPLTGGQDRILTAVCFDVWAIPWCFPDWCWNHWFRSSVVLAKGCALVANAPHFFSRMSKIFAFWWFSCIILNVCSSSWWTRRILTFIFNIFSFIKCPLRHCLRIQPILLLHRQHIRQHGKSISSIWQEPLSLGIASNIRQNPFQLQSIVERILIIPLPDLIQPLLSVTWKLIRIWIIIGRLLHICFLETIGIHHDFSFDCTLPFYSILGILHTSYLCLIDVQIIRIRHWVDGYVSKCVLLASH